MKKVSNRERRRRQNENLRRLLTPKNALMVLNEMMPNEQVANVSVEDFHQSPPTVVYTQEKISTQNHNVVLAYDK